MKTLDAIYHNVTVTRQRLLLKIESQKEDCKIVANLSHMPGEVQAFINAIDTNKAKELVRDDRIR